MIIIKAAIKILRVLRVWLNWSIEVEYDNIDLFALMVGRNISVMISREVVSLHHSLFVF